MLRLRELRVGRLLLRRELRQEQAAVHRGPHSLLRHLCQLLQQLLQVLRHKLLLLLLLLLLLQAWGPRLLCLHQVLLLLLLLLLLLQRRAQHPLCRKPRVQHRMQLRHLLRGQHLLLLRLLLLLLLLGRLRVGVCQGGVGQAGAEGRLKRELQALVQLLGAAKVQRGAVPVAHAHGTPQRCGRVHVGECVNVCM